MSPLVGLVTHTVWGDWGSGDVQDVLVCFLSASSLVGKQGNHRVSEPFPFLAPAKVAIVSMETTTTGYLPFGVTGVTGDPGINQMLKHGIVCPGLAFFSLEMGRRGRREGAVVHFGVFQVLFHWRFGLVGTSSPESSGG